MDLVAVAKEVSEHEAVAMQPIPLRDSGVALEGGPAAVEPVADDGVADMGQMASDLMLPTCSNGELRLTQSTDGAVDPSLQEDLG